MAVAAAMITVARGTMIVRPAAVLYLDPAVNWASVTIIANKALYVVDGTAAVTAFR